MDIADSLKYDFDYKNEILAGWFDEVNPFTFYETVFPIRTFIPIPALCPMEAMRRCLL